MDSPLAQRVPYPATEDAILEAFLDYATKDLGLTLYPAQEEAILEIVAGNHVILNTPTGSGKSLVATAAHFAALARGQRAFYTCPIKALANEKFFALAREFGPNNVGLLTGDAQVNAGAPIVCATAEILANMALREGKRCPVDHVVMDEFHYYGDKERGAAWQIPLLEMPQTTFMLMSATLGDVSVFVNDLEKRTKKPVKVVRGAHRPVPLQYSYSEDALHETVVDLTRGNKAPVYVVSFTQRGAAEEAQNLMSIDVCSKEEKKEIAAALLGVRFDSPYGKELQRFVRHGIGLHHAGLLPKYRLMVEKLAQRGLLKVISGTDTLGVGVNVPIRTVLLTKLCKYDGEKTVTLPVRDFHQISGRAGRRGFDNVGYVVVQAPEHVIENARLESKAAGDPKKLRKIVRRKPPDRGYVHWDKATFERIQSSQPEPLVSRFSVTHGMIMEMLQREDNGGCMGIARMLRKVHERPAAQRALGRTAMAMYKSLLEAQIIQRVPTPGGGTRSQVNQDLHEDFSLHQALSLYLIDTLPLLDHTLPTYALDALTLVESILEHPEVILMRQLDKLKSIKMAELKQAGIEFDQRIEELDKLEYPKPNASFIYDTFNEFARKHPWVGENIRPKSIARDMYEQFLNFPEYVKEYGLERSEGLVLRYLSEVYKVLVQTVPPSDRTPELDEIATYFGAIVRQVDSSLLDEWERMRNPDAAPKPPEDDTVFEPEGSRDVTRDAKGFRILVQNAIFEVVRALARGDSERAKEHLDDSRWTALALREAMAPFYEDCGKLRADADARNAKHLTLTPQEWTLDFEQVLLGDDGPSPFVMRGAVDLEGSRLAGRAVFKLKEITRV